MDFGCLGSGNGRVLYLNRFRFFKYINNLKPSVRGPTAAFILFDRKENEAKETLSITVARLMCSVETVDYIE